MSSSTKSKAVVSLYAQNLSMYKMCTVPNTCARFAPCKKCTGTEDWCEYTKKQAIISSKKLPATREKIAIVVSVEMNENVMDMVNPKCGPGFIVSLCLKPF